MYENYQKTQQAKVLNNYIEIVKHSSTLIHELQKERGLSSSYLGNPKEKTKNTLKVQRDLTNKAIKQYLNFFVNKKQQDTLIDIFEKINQIDNIRVQIDTQKITFYDEIKYFSLLIKNIIHYIQNPNENVSTASLSDFESLISLINLKEYAGIERAYLANIFAQNSISLTQLKDIQKIILNQDLYYKTFLRYTPKKIYLIYKEKIPYKLEMEVKAFRDIILKSHNTNNFNIDSLTWYNIATQRIDNLHSVLAKLLNEINTKVKTNKDNAYKSLLFSIILWILSILAFLFIWYIVYQMVKLEQSNIQKLKQQQRRYSAISNLSNSISYIKDDITLYHNLCKTLLDIEGLSVTWIGKIDEIQNIIKPIVSENFELHKLEKINFDLTNKYTTPAKAYAYDKHIIHNTTDIQDNSLCKNILDRSIKTIASFPIYMDKKAVSILTIFATQQDIFDSQLIDLIEKLLKGTSNSLEFLKLRSHEEEIIQELNIASYAFESQEAMTITDANANIIRVNKAFEEITGYKQEEVIGKNPSVLKSEKQSAEFYATMWSELKKHGKWKGEIYNKRKNGEIYPELLSITAIKNNQGETTHYLAQFLDISDIKRLQKEAEFRADHDPLTSLTNRSKLKQKTKQAFLEAKNRGIQHAFFFLDIDNFKYINDFYGHATGDEILINIASKLKQCIIDNDIVARLGGDEFAILSYNVGTKEVESIQKATKIAKNIQTIMKEPININGHHFDITFSIGVKIFPNLENSYEDVIPHADIAMYKAKKSGKNKFAFFDTELDIELKQFSLLEKEIKHALINKEFKLYYQPKIDTNTNKMIGMEALVRWFHPTKGILSPDKFLKTVADTKNMYLLETILIEQVLQQIAKWQLRYNNFDYKIAINITPKSFLNDKFIPFLKNKLKTYNVSPKLIELELLESTFIDDLTLAVNKIKILKSLGIDFAIDDFGTGYSSLTYLQKLPIDSIKIDKSFIMNIKYKSNREIVKMIINFAKLFKLKVVAEGVENINTLDFLQTLGCDYYQGYFFSRPVSSKEIENMLTPKSNS
jgi:diguanylate cyclase (GGDEF)-like protein/PAS domain S-box-containing protein